MKTRCEFTVARIRTISANLGQSAKSLVVLTFNEEEDIEIFLHFADSAFAAEFASAINALTTEALGKPLGTTPET